MRLVNQVHVKSVAVLLLWCLLGAVTKHTAQKKDTKTRQRDGRGQEIGGGTKQGERTKESEAGVGGCQEQGDKREGRGVHERTHTEEDKLEEKSILQDRNYTNTTTAGLFFLFWYYSEITASLKRLQK